MRRAGLLLGLALAGPAGAQDVSPPAIAVLTPSVRAAGMAGAGVSLLGSPGAVWDNPSAIAPLRVFTLEASGALHGDGAAQGGASAAVRAGPVSLAGGVQYLRLDADSIVDNVSWVAAATWRGGFGAFGADVRYVSVEDTAGTVARTLTSDVGLSLAFFDIAALAVAVQGIGRLRTSGPDLGIPTQTRLGFTLNLVDPLGVPRLLVTIERVWVSGADDRMLFGAEGGFVREGFGVLARAGIGAGAPGAGESGGTLGATVVIRQVFLDYAWQERNRFGGPVHRVGVRLAP